MTQEQVGRIPYQIIIIKKIIQFLPKHFWKVCRSMLFTIEPVPNVAKMPSRTQLVPV